MAPIPSMLDKGILPAGSHICSMAELEATFAYNDRRRAIVQGLKETLSELPNNTSVDYVLVDGSFVEAKREPNDVDAVLVVKKMGDGSPGTAVATWVAQRQRTLKAERHCHLFVADQIMVDGYWNQFFGHTREGVAKGNLRLTGGFK
jgi:hypothetical protein